MYFDIVLRYQLLGTISGPVRMLLLPLPLPPSLLTKTSLLHNQLPKIRGVPGQLSTNQPWVPCDSTCVAQWLLVVCGNRGHPR